MKKIVTTLLVLIPLTVLAQEGTVLYEETNKVEIDLPPEMAHMKAEIPDSRTVTNILYFNESASLMKAAPAADDTKTTDISHESDGMRFRMKFDQPKEETYTNLDEESMVRQRDFMGRTFLVTDDSPSPQWQLTDDRSEFLGQMCQKAVTTIDSMRVEAWFTPQIPIAAGPSEFNGLPGLILVVNVDDGRRSIVAKELNLGPLGENVLTAPTKGRKVTQAEFDEIVEKKMKEMGAENDGPGGNRIIIRRN